MKPELVLKEVLKEIELDKKELLDIKENVENFIRQIKLKIAKMNQKPEVFVGGSYAKKTMITKNKYDVDIFLRYDKKNSDAELSEKTRKLLSGFNSSVVHGSRDYFRIKINEKLFIEVVPVIKVNSPKNSKNITDLSYSHVKYINKKIKNKKILDEIKIAKAFCYANKCYGAESYIKGFSGYSLELLIYYYKSFMKMIRELSKPSGKNDKIIIDIERKYKNKKNILLDMNSSKLESPIILVDPTFEQRNALAALSYDTFERFGKICREFIKNPSIKYFEEEKIDLEKLKKKSLKNKYEFLLIEANTEKPEGDVAGSKLLKFYNYLNKEIERFFYIKDTGFDYNEGRMARYFFIVSKKKEIVYDGPFANDEKNVTRFKKEHKKIYENKGRLHSKEKLNLSFAEFLSRWVVKNEKRLDDMSINKIKITDKV